MDKKKHWKVKDTSKMHHRPWNKGQHGVVHSSKKGKTFEEIYGSKKANEIKEKISQNNGKGMLGKKRVFTKVWRKKIGDGNRGKIISTEVRTKISATNKIVDVGKWMIGKKLSKSIRQKMSASHKGDKSYSWKGGITLQNRILRNGIEFRLWREAVFARDNWTCQKCGQRGSCLHPHHIKNFAQYPELRFAIDNGITLCKECHRKFHKMYGYTNNTIEQLQEFLKNT